MTGFGYNINTLGAYPSRTVFTEATGGTVTTSGDYKIHTFNSSGTFSVTQVGSSASVDYLVIAGGGGGGPGHSADYRQGGGGGAGGYLTSTFSALVGDYTITVGAGGAQTNNGSNASIIKASDSSNIATSVGGGTLGAVGGSGGGAQVTGEGSYVGSAGSGTSGQGNAGGAGSVTSYTVAAGGGGGGSSAAGGAGSGNTGGAAPLP